MNYFWFSYELARYKKSSFTMMNKHIWIYGVRIKWFVSLQCSSNSLSYISLWEETRSLVFFEIQWGIFCSLNHFKSSEVFCWCHYFMFFVKDVFLNELKYIVIPSVAFLIWRKKQGVFTLFIWTRMNFFGDVTIQKMIHSAKQGEKND